MSRKESSLILQDLAFYITGKADVALLPTHEDDWLYPADWEYQLTREQIHFAPKDERGIPIRRYPELGDQYLFSRIAAYALAHWNRLRRSADEDSRAKFMLTVDWLAEFDDGRYEHQFAVADMPVGWISCISQGEVASALARAYLLTQDERYRTAAAQAIHWLMLPIDQGGLLGTLPDGKPFLEEYPGTKYRHVLNGCLYAMIGMHDFIRVAPSAAPVTALFDQLVDAVGANIEQWDVSGWSRYDYPSNPPERVPNLNTMTYQILQLALLRHLGRVSGDIRLQTMADRWDRSARSIGPRLRAMAGKTAYRLSSGWR